MNTLFDITGDDIVKLSDSGLRELVGRLCEADVRQRSGSASGVTWGGDQNARDGGIDVFVTGDASIEDSFVRRANAGFQVKKQKMPEAAILKEMKPKGKLRPSIKELIKKKGAYIIVSSESVSDSVYKNRVQSIRKILGKQPGARDLHIDFFDRTRLATWVRSHPSIILWLRSKIGSPLTGWMPFGNWSGDTSVDQRYILDESMRLRHLTDRNSEEMSMSSGLTKISSILSQPRVSIRLTGLSGVGKTRFVQAIFETGLIENALNPDLAIYTDMGSDPMPDPTTLAGQLVALRAKAVIIVDNCNPKLHRALTKICSQGDSLLSLLTIEYDIKDDIPEETEVFSMDPASDQVIETVIKKRFPKISIINIMAIVKFSGGNARVAIALAGTVGIGDDLASLRDEDLFLRLFQQRNESNDDLLRAAQVCSLVYSFEGTQFGESSELKILGGLVNMNALELYKHVNTLSLRSLMQSRDVWRAILPHAISNRLAKNALASIPPPYVSTTFHNLPDTRLLISFSRRLIFLHESPAAIEVASSWLRPNGIIGESQGMLSLLQHTLLDNIAPVVPLETLEFLERKANGNDGANFTSRGNPNFSKIVKLLCLLAFDKQLFYRSVKLIIRFALTERMGENNNSIRRQLEVLFQMLLSGTHATVGQRIEVISELVRASTEREQELGTQLLDRALRTGSFTGNDFTFGARPRDYGLRPKTYEEWYAPFIELCASIGEINEFVRRNVHQSLANHFRGLWKHGLYSILESAAHNIHSISSWIDGWVAVRRTMFYDGKNYDETVVQKLLALENLLRPRSLMDRVRAFVVVNPLGLFDFEADPIGNPSSLAHLDTINERIHSIAIEVVHDEETFNALLPELLSTSNGRFLAFGAGLAEGSSNVTTTWNKLCDALDLTTPGNRTYNLILGYLRGCIVKDPIFYNSTLDDMVTSNLFKHEFPRLQCCLPIDGSAMTRLNKTLDLCLARADAFSELPYARFGDMISESEYISLHAKLFSHTNGAAIVIDSLNSRFRMAEERLEQPSPELLQFSGQVLADYNFSGVMTDSIDQNIASLAQMVLKENETHAMQLCLNLRRVQQDFMFFGDFKELTVTLSQIQPRVFLTVYVQDYDQHEKDPLEELTFMNYTDDGILDGIPENEIVNWCQSNPSKNIPNILGRLYPLRGTADTGKIEFKPIAKRLLGMAPNLTLALQSVGRSMVPYRWASLGEIVMMDHVQALKELAMTGDLEIKHWVDNIIKDIEVYCKSIEQERERRMRSVNRTFE